MKLLATLAAALLLSPGDALAAGSTGQDRRKVTKRVSFVSADGVRPSADLYLSEGDSKTPFLVLFHHGMSGRTEYRDIAPSLRRKGFDSMAVDLRAGSTAKRVGNRTAKHQTPNKSLADAELDVIAALQYARKSFPKKKIVAVGCSYSASLALRVAGTHPDLVDGVAAFSPGEFFEPVSRSTTWVLEAVGTIACPVFITSARAEESEWTAIFEAIPDARKTAFLAPGRGIHGVEVLAEKGVTSTAVWTAFEEFLGQPMGAPPATETPVTDGRPGDATTDG
jgi:pimeloyl-ACP methyl ester carboxylesterase